MNVALRYTIVHSEQPSFEFEMNIEKKSLSNAEKMKKWREEKIKKKKAADKKYYQQNREHKIAEVQENRECKKCRRWKGKTRAMQKSQEKKVKPRAREERQEKNLAAEERREKIRQQTRERVKRLREKRREEMRQEHAGMDGRNTEEETCSTTPVFRNRMTKS